MKVHWNDPFAIRKLDDLWDSEIAKPGIYIIRRPKPVPRIGATDPTGILYIGKSRGVWQRLTNFRNANHIASWFLYLHPELARIVLRKRVRTGPGVVIHLPSLTAQVAVPIRPSQLARAERAVLYAYLRAYGEPPPLNFSFLRRELDAPSQGDLRWGRRGIMWGA